MLRLINLIKKSCLVFQGTSQKPHKINDSPNKNEN